MKTRGWKIEDGRWLARSVLECGGPPPHSDSVELPSCPQSARGLAQSKTWRTILAFCLLPLAFCLCAQAQYSIDWFTIDGGGGTSTGGTYQVSGTIGQADAGGSLTGGPVTGTNYFSVTGGFWSLVFVVQTAGLPNLLIVPTGPNSVKVLWPNTGNYTLQQSTNFAAPGGWTTSGYSISTSNGTNSITITPPTGNQFFRLQKP